MQKLIFLGTRNEIDHLKKLDVNGRKIL